MWGLYKPHFCEDYVSKLTTIVTEVFYLFPVLQQSLQIHATNNGSQNQHRKIPVSQRHYHPGQIQRELKLKKWTIGKFSSLSPKWQSWDMWLFRNIFTKEKNFLFITPLALFFSINENYTMLWYSEEHSAI